MRTMIASTLLLLAASASPSAAGTLGVTMDGLFDEWGATAPVWTDPNGDGPTDWGRLWVADDARFLYLRLECGVETNLDESNLYVIYLDTDNNASTGLSVGGIGAELEWKLGVRNGKFYRSGNPTVYHDNLRFRAFPTVSASEFEMCFGRDVLPDGVNPLFFGSTLKILIKDTAGGGDQLPDVGQTLSYTMDLGAQPPKTPVPFGRSQTTDLRVSTQNGHNDSPYNATLGPKFRRLYQATAPDVITFQEIYNHTAAETQALVASWLGGTWYAADNNDCQTVSRYPILSTWNLDGNLAVLLNTTAAIGSQMLVVNGHLPCCTDDAGRQMEVDHILQFLRDAKDEPGGLIDLPVNTPVMITGDMNFVGSSQPLRSLLTGDIVNQGTYGADFQPDWDGTALGQVISIQTEKRTTWTWRSDTSDFWPGRLDFMIYSDGELDVANHYVVYTREMSADSLVAHGLQLADSDASDHVLQIADFRPVGPPSGLGGAPVEPGGLHVAVAPNPARGLSKISFSLPSPEGVRLEVFDARGRRLATPYASRGAVQGPVCALWNGTDAFGAPLPSGVYFLRVRSTRGTLGESRVSIIR